MDEKLRAILEDELMFAKESAEYLGISVQRLNILVHSGELQPVKASKSGTIFLKRDLDERIKSQINIGKELLTPRFCNNLDIEGPNIIPAINYFTLQSYFDFAQEKTRDFYSKVKNKYDQRVPLYKNKDLINEVFHIDEEDYIKKFLNTKKCISKLLENDHITSCEDQNYPIELKRLEKKPEFLFLRGNREILNKSIVAFTGCRNPIDEERELAFKIAIFLSEKGYTIATGLSKGIEATIAEILVRKEYPIIGVIGTGLNRVFPVENENLQNDIGKKGLIISQFSPSAPVKRWQFPIRGKVLAGIAQFLVVIDYKLTEGEYKMIEYSLKNGRIVFFPFPKTQGNSWIDRFLIKKGMVFFKDFTDFKEQFKKIVGF